MKRVSDVQTNTKIYWNDSYGDPVKAFEYKASSHRFTEAVKYVKDGDKFLDLGCGVAKPARQLHEDDKKAEIWGVDISDVVIEQNKKDFPNDKYFQGYIDDLGFLPKNYFDVVFCGEVIEHLDDPDVLFTLAYDIIKPGGLLIVTTPIENRVQSTEHIWSFDKQDMERFFSKFKSVEFIKMPDLEHLFVFFVVGTK